MIKANNLTKKYGNFTALEDINLEIDKGKIVGLLGANGSGKTTFIKLVAGLLSPTSGDVTIDDNKPGVETKKVVSYLPENNALDLDMKVSETIGYYKDFFEDFDEEKAKKLIGNFGIDLNQKMKNLSKGMKEKVQLVLCISRNANYYILDEPIGGVDPASRDHILDTILNNFNKNATIIWCATQLVDINKKSSVLKRENSFSLFV